MKFSKDTSRLVEGRWYWFAASETGHAQRAIYSQLDSASGYLWGDECPPPTVEVEPEPPAWTPPVCPAGQVLLLSRYPKPAWPPRIGEIVEIDHHTGWVPVTVTSGPLDDSLYPGDYYVYAAPFVLKRSAEGRGWRWVYRDLSGYTPPGGSNV